MQSADIYQYQPLTSSRSIRLLRLQRDWSSADGSICGILEEVNLDRHPPYHAISYAWGNPTPEIEFRCNGLRLLVTRSCHEALTRLMRGKFGRTVWIDGICINQNSMTERSQQVELMATVYRNASKVLVWLGPGTEASDLAMAELKRLSVAALTRRHRQAIERLRVFDGENIIKYPFGILAEVFRRPWFQRLWVIQEVVMAQGNSVMFYCGDRMIHFVNLCAAVDTRQIPGLDLVQRQWASYVGFLLAMKHLVKLRDEGKQLPSNFGLTTALFAIMFKKATLPEDKVFGIYGLAMHVGWHLPKPSYCTPLARIYTEATRAAIETDNNLDILRLATKPKAQDLPSWVPDYSQLPHSILKPMKEFKAAGGASEFHELAQWSPNNTEMIVKGVLLDVVHVRGGTLEWPMQQTIYNDIIPSVEMSVNALQVAQSWFCLANDLSDCYEATDESTIFAFARTLFTDGLQDRDATGAIELFMEVFYPFFTGPVPSPEGIMQRLTHDKRFHYACSLSIFMQMNRSFVLTGGGKMATVPALTKEQDLIVAFAGSSFPFVIRQRDVKFELIGPAYVHGAMDGEFWPEDKRGLTDFILI